MIHIPYPQLINELSFEEQEDRYRFLEKIKTLLEVIDEMHSIGFNYQLAFVGSLKQRICVSGITFEKWLFSRDGSEEELEIKKRLKSLFTKGALIEDILSLDCGKEVSFRGRELGLSGLLASYYFALPSISMQSQSFQNQYKISLTISELNADGEIETHNEDVYSVNHTNQISQIVDDNMNKMLTEIGNGKDLLLHANEMLSLLDFSTTAKEQLEKLNSSSYINNGFSWICFTLLKLNHIMHLTLQDDDMNFLNHIAHSISISNESRQTKERYRGTRTFAWDDGIQRDCWLHVKNKGNNIRIHLLPDPLEKKLYVGYIGEHLPTVKFTH
jgi:hypothetical protein